MSGIKRATVFGGSGFIGRYVVRRLARLGAVVAVVSRHATRAAYLQPMGDVGQIALINASLGQDEVLRRALDGADTVVNLVGILAEGGGQRFDAVHGDGAGLVARLAAEAGAERLLHVSAIGADRASPSRYARSKAAGEAAVRAHFPTAHNPAPVDRVRAGGPVLQPLRGDGKALAVPAADRRRRDAVPAGLCRRCRRCRNRGAGEPGACGRTYELGGPTIYTFRELMELMLKEIDPHDDSSAFNRHALLTVPFWLAELLASIVGILPGAPLTRDQVTLLKRDNVAAPGVPGLSDLGIAPTAPELILPSYLNRFRRGGWYSTRRMA